MDIIKPRFLLLALLSLIMLASPACQRKGLKCPSPGKTSTSTLGPGGKSMESVKVTTDKNGLVKKKKFLKVL